MTSKRSRLNESCYNRFLDLSAQESRGSDDEDVEEEGETDAILDFDEPDFDDQLDDQHRQLLFQDRRDDHATYSRIAEVVQAFYQRPNSVSTLTTCDNDLPQKLLLPTVNDVPLWMVPVKTGREQMAVFRIMEMILETPSSTGILSAFTIPSIPSRIYIEANNYSSIQSTCQNLIDIYTWNITVIPVNECTRLLCMEFSDRRLAIGTWIRIRRGLYKDDIGLVLRSTSNCDEYTVVVVPRIPMDLDASTPSYGKRKRTIRPSPRLFNISQIRSVYKDQPIVERDDGSFDFKGNTYHNGLLLMDLDSANVERANPLKEDTLIILNSFDSTLEEFRPFVDFDFTHDDIFKPVSVDFHVGDFVKILHGGHNGVCGRVEEVNRDVALIKVELLEPNNDPATNDAIAVPVRNIQRHFRIGDDVRILHGMNSGRSGVVIVVDDYQVTLIDDKSTGQIIVPLEYVEFHIPEFKFTQKPVEVTSTGQHFKDPSVGKQVYVISGNHKGCLGEIRAMGNNAIRVLLEANLTIQTLKPSELVFMDSGTAVDGHVLSEDWIATFKAMKSVQIPTRSCTPPPDPDEADCNWGISGSDKEDPRSTGDETGMWLLQPEVTRHFPQRSFVVQFSRTFSTTSGFFQGRYENRCGSTVMPTPALAPSAPNEITLSWTDKSAKRLQMSVPVRFLVPMRPFKNKEGVVIRGEHIGTVITLLKHKEGTVHVSDGTISFDLPVENVCRVT